MLQQHQVLLCEMCFLLFQMDLRLLLISILLGAFYDSYAQKGTFLIHIFFLLISIKFQRKICHFVAFILHTPQCLSFQLLQRSFSFPDKCVCKYTHANKPCCARARLACPSLRGWKRCVWAQHGCSHIYTGMLPTQCEKWIHDGCSPSIAASCDRDVCGDGVL